MGIIRRAAFVLLAMLLAAAPASALEVGSGLFEMAEPSGARPELPLRVHYHRSTRWTVDRPILIVMHGVRRDADRYLAEWRNLAEERGLLVLCPEFSEAKYPGVRWYNLGNVADRERGGSLQPAPERTFHVADQVFVEARRRSGATRTQFALFGHSAGAQHVHRYLLFAVGSMADPIIVANAGWYTLPNPDVTFPYGLGGTGLSEAAQRRALARRVVVLLGAADTDPNHPSLRRNAEADAQGVTRLARGQHFFAVAGARARALGGAFAWRLETVSGVAHDNAGMARRAVELIEAR